MQNRPRRVQNDKERALKRMRRYYEEKRKKEKRVICQLRGDLSEISSKLDSTADALRKKTLQYDEARQLHRVCKAYCLAKDYPSDPNKGQAFHNLIEALDDVGFHQAGPYIVLEQRSDEDYKLDQKVIEQIYGIMKERLNKKT